MIDPQVAEECVNGVVDCIREFVDVLRAEFPAVVSPPKPTVSSTCSSDSASLSVLALYTRMSERGVLEQVQKAVQKQQTEWNSRRPREESSDVGSSSSSSSCYKAIYPINDGTADQHQHHHQHQQRIALLQEIILPTLRSLTECYHVLDAIPQTPQEVAASNNNPNNSSSGRRNKKQDKPAPPRGMLSIQQYTDIACFLEFTVCTAILPQLDYHVIATLDDRIRYLLPKSLAGRIPRISLSWGANTRSMEHLSNAASSSCQEDDEVVLLLETASTISALILLDRFRPMLLPRHISDIYAAIFQYEHNHGFNNSSSSQNQKQQHSVLYQSLGLQETAAATSKTSATPTPNFNDATLQAKAYQTLLLQGTQTPIWLRQRVAPLLTELACTNLAAIVQVFVPLQQQQHGEVSTMASQRLGRTLATSSANTVHYTQRLGQQIRLLLEALFVTLESGQIPARAMAILQTIWAVLYHWPKDLVQQELIRPWQQSLLQQQQQQQGGDNKATSTTILTPPKASPTIHKTLRQIGSLCASVPPPATDPWRILQHLFIPTPASGGSVSEFHSSSIMNQLVRVAATRTGVVKSTAKEEARQIVHWLCQATTAASTTTATTAMPEGTNLPSSLTLLASAWVHAFVPNEWDMTGYAYKHQVVASTEDNSSKSPSRNLEMICFEKIDLQGAGSISFLVEEIQKRFEFFFEICVVAVDQEGSDPLANEGSKAAPLQSVAPLVFRLLLKLYLSGYQGVSSTTAIQVNWTHQLVAAVVLPLLCEKCSPETLLFGPGSETGALGLLHSIKTILDCAKARLVGQKEESLTKDIGRVQEKDSPDEDADEDDTIMLHCLKILKFDESVTPMEISPGSALIDQKDQDDTIVSIASIVLSLLIAVLELGSKLRSDEEEKALQSLLPILSVLAEFGNQDRTRIMADQGTNAGISDMAGYAAALIASRKAQERQEAPKAPNAAPSLSDKVWGIIQEAQEDLESTQPPIRARGMVSLGRLARGYLGILKPNESKSKLIEELGDGLSSEKNLIEFTIREVLRLAIKALSDAESYVYLAAVQTIVAIGDLQPKHVLPRLGAAIVTGKVDVEEEGFSISNEQRIKLAEALMFIIRRRAAPAEYLPQLMDLMIFGSVDKIGAVNNSTPGSDDYMRLFTQETRKYFLETEEDESALIESTKETWKERDIRAKTGGPMFAREEHDLVRSIRLSTIAELMSVVPPAALVPYCRLLIQLATNVLRLDASRSACRAAALLAREFYGCLLREHDELSALVDTTTQHVESSLLQFAVAIITNEDEEDLLIKTLQEHSAGSETFAIGEYTHDLAVTARSQEALALRDEGEDILQVARLVEATQQNSNIYSIPDILKIRI